MDVVIAAYNAERTIDATLASVASQTLPAASVVVVDDGSNDRTAERAERWRTVLPVTVVRQENLGPSGARRRGAALGSSPFILFLDADDLILPDHLAVLCDGMPSAGVIRAPVILRWVPEHSLELDRNRVRRTSQRTSILQANFVPAASVFSRVDYNRAGGCRIRVGADFTEDWDLWIRLVAGLGVAVEQAHHPTFIYRLSSSSRSAGCRQFKLDVATLAIVVDDLADSDLRSVAQRGLRDARARLWLAKSYEEAEAHRVRRARRLAWLALQKTSSWPLRTRAVALLVAPISTARARSRHRASR